MSNAVLDIDELTRPLDSSDSDRIAHIVLEGFKGEDDKFISAQEAGLPGGSVVDSMVFGTEVIALCGQKIVAKDNPYNKPLCQACQDAAKSMGWKIPS